MTDRPALARDPRVPYWYVPKDQRERPRGDGPGCAFEVLLKVYSSKEMEAFENMVSGRKSRTGKFNRKVLLGGVKGHKNLYREKLDEDGAAVTETWVTFEDGVSVLEAESASDARKIVSREERPVYEEVKFEGPRSVDYWRTKHRREVTFELLDANDVNEDDEGNFD